MKAATKGLALIIIIITAISCATEQPKKKPDCPPEVEYGNAGNKINTAADEINPFIFNDNLIFLSNKAENASFSMYYSKIQDGLFTPAQQETDPPFNKIDNSSHFSFLISNNKINEIYFSKNNNSGIENILKVSKTGAAWNEPVSFLPEPNEQGTAKHPAISPDSSFLVFSLKNENTGKSDLFISYKNPDNSWTSPEKLNDKINSAGTEITPFTSEKGDLYFASDRTGGNLNIFRAKKLSANNWATPQKMSFPINSDFDEKTPYVMGNKIYLASNRPGGCGGFDIYSFEICGPVMVRGEVLSGASGLPVEGQVALMEVDEKVVEKTEIDETGKFSFNALPEKKYIVRYENDCLKDHSVEKVIESPCSDSSSVLIKVSFELPRIDREYTFEQYNIPFFVSGYYLPNTTENLRNLRARFEQGTIGSDDTTRYIGEPESKYGMYAMIVDSAMNEAVEFILKKLRAMEESCLRRDEQLYITTKGFADPRKIYDNAKYDGPAIDNELLDFHVERGAKVDNLLLSRLRAYFTAIHFQNLLRNKADYQRFKDHIRWKIIGVGIDDNAAKPNELKRRVSVKISLNPG